MKPIHFIQHDARDDCAVAVIEGVSKSDVCNLWVMDGDAEATVSVNADIPIGHKVALKDLESGSDVLKYGNVIGRLVSSVKKGDHLHVHNLKTKRW